MKEEIEKILEGVTFPDNRQSTVGLIESLIQKHCERFAEWLLINHEWKTIDHDNTVNWKSYSKPTENTKTISELFTEYLKTIKP